MNTITLNTIKEQFKIIAGLQTGERLQTTDQKITGVYEAAYGRGSFGFALTSFRQTLHRRKTGQSTEESGKVIRVQIASAKTEIEKIDASQEISIEEGTKMIEELVQFKEQLILEGWKELEKTSLQGLNSLFAMSPTKLKQRKEAFELISQEREALRKLINQKISQLTEQMQLQAQKAEKALLAAQEEAQKSAVRSLVFQMLDPENCPGGAFAARYVEKVLKELFGCPITDDMFRAYALLGKTHLTTREIQALLVGISANLALVDVEYMIKSKAWEACPNGSLRALMEKAWTDGLSNQTLYPLLLQLRDLRLPPEAVGQTLSETVSNALGSIRKDSSPSFNETQLQSDVARILAYRRVAEYENYAGPDQLKKINWSEYLARDIAYVAQGAREGTLFPMFDGSKRDSHVCLQLRQVVNRDGLYCNMARPAFLEEEAGEVSLYPLMQGTFDWNGLMRDLHYAERETGSLLEGPGTKSWNDCETEIVRTILDEMAFIHQQTAKPIRFIGVGHSLGASDTMRLIKALSKQYATVPDGTLPPLAGVEMYPYNAPGLEERPLKDFVESARMLPKISFNLVYPRAVGDIVEYVATGVLGAVPNGKGSLPRNVRSTVLVFFNEEIQKDLMYRLKAHTNYMMAGEKNQTYLLDVQTNSTQWEGLKMGEKGNIPVKPDPASLQFGLRSGCYVRPEAYSSSIITA